MLHNLYLFAMNWTCVCMFVCMYVYVCIRTQVLQPWTPIRKSLCNHGHTNHGRLQLSETRHSVANRIDMHVKRKCPMMDLHK